MGGVLFDPYTERFGRLIAEYCLDLRPREHLLIRAGIPGLEGIRSLYKAAVERGAFPIVLFSDSVMSELFYRHAPRELLEFESPLELLIQERVEATARIISSDHTKPLTSADPEKLRLRSRAMRRLSEVFMRRDSEGSLKWVVTIYPTPADAQEAGFAPLEWREFIFKAMKLDRPDPVAEWRRFAEEQRRIRDALSKADELRLEGPGISLTVRVGGRTWIEDDGRNNMPGGEVFTAPHEDATEGTVAFDYPAVWRGIEVEGVKLVFKRGRVVEATAQKGEEHLRKLLDTDEGARVLGEFAFGLNYDITRHTKQILLDEKIGGTIHMALGAAYPRTGGKNQSSIHWDMVKDMKKATVKADGDTIYQNGNFLLDVI